MFITDGGLFLDAWCEPHALGHLNGKTMHIFKQRMKG
jgi:hypothetical protein